MTTYGKFFKEHRLKQGLSLRQFCKSKGLDPAYVSRIENDIIPAPIKEDVLEALAQSIDIKKMTKEWVEFHDLASISRGKIPKDVQEKYPEVLSILPAFFRSIGKKRMTENDVKELIKLVRDGYDDPEKE